MTHSIHHRDHNQMQNSTEVHDIAINKATLAHTSRMARVRPSGENTTPLYGCFEPRK
jgi:hypothetical protein